MFPISNFKSFSDQERHDYILKTFILNKAAVNQHQKRDIDVIKEHHRFLWNESDCLAAADSWETRLARKYYDKLFKEYCIADLTRYKENKIALRWRTEAEVIAGIGQFQCGSRKCEDRDELRSWEVNFAYQEQGERKNALVKLRLCPGHSAQLNFTSRKREVKRLKRAERHNKKTVRHKKSSNKCDETVAQTNEAEADESESVADKEATTDTVEAGSSNMEQQQLNANENIWSKKLDVEAEFSTRENEFEKYLEDLLL